MDKHPVFPNRRLVTRRLCKRIATWLTSLSTRNQYDSNFVAFSVSNNQSKRFVLASELAQLPCLSIQRPPEICRLDFETGNITSSFTLSLTTHNHQLTSYTNLCTSAPDTKRGDEKNQQPQKTQPRQLLKAIEAEDNKNGNEERKQLGSLCDPFWTVKNLLPASRLCPTHCRGYARMKLEHSFSNTSVNVLQHQFRAPQESFGIISSTELNIQFCGEARGTHAGKSGGGKIVG